MALTQQQIATRQRRAQRAQQAAQLGISVEQLNRQIRRQQQQAPVAGTPPIQGLGSQVQAQPPALGDLPGGLGAYNWIRSPSSGEIWAVPQAGGTAYKVPNFEAFQQLGIPWGSVQQQDIGAALSGYGQSVWPGGEPPPGAYQPTPDDWPAYAGGVQPRPGTGYDLPPPDPSNPYAYWNTPGQYTPPPPDQPNYPDQPGGWGSNIGINILGGGMTPEQFAQMMLVMQEMAQGDQWWSGLGQIGTLGSPGGAGLGGNVPGAQQFGTQYNPATAARWTQNPYIGQSAFTGQPAAAWPGIATALQSILPYREANRAAYQWQQEYEEASRRWASEMNMRAALEQWQQGMAEQQFGLDEATEARLREQMEWQQAFTGEQWGQQFGLQEQAEARLREQMEAQVSQWADQFGLDEQQEQRLREQMEWQQQFTQQQWGQQFGLQQQAEARLQEQLQQQAAQFAQQFGLSQQQEARLLEQMQWQQGFQESQWGQQYGLQSEAEARLREQMEYQQAATVAGLTGRYGGAPTLAAQELAQQASQWAQQLGLSQQQEARLREQMLAQQSQFGQQFGLAQQTEQRLAETSAWQQAMQRAQLTGTLGGQQTLGAQELAQQAQQWAQQYGLQQQAEQRLGQQSQWQQAFAESQWGQQYGLQQQAEERLGQQSAWQQQFGEQQWGQQFRLQQEAEQRLAAESAWRQQWAEQEQATQLAWERERQRKDIEAQKEIALMQGLGRSMRPNVRWM